MTEHLYVNHVPTFKVTEPVYTDQLHTFQMTEFCVNQPPQQPFRVPDSAYVNQVPQPVIMPERLCPNPPQPIYMPSPSSITNRLLHLCSTTGYELIQYNGQRRLGPPPNWCGPPPPKGSEVFVGRLPRDMYEDELFPLFWTVGPIYEIRLMMNFSGYNRGFGFVTFCHPQDAWMAVSQLNHYEVRPGHKIGVSKSVDNCRLYVGGIPLEKNKQDAYLELSKYLQGITNIIMYTNKEKRNENRGFMFVEFCSHRAAAMAKRKMSPGTVALWNKNVVVDWADPEPDIEPIVLASVTKLFIRNLSSTVTDKVLRRLLSNFVPTTAVERIYVADDYAFIHFDNRVHAQIAKDRLTGIVIDSLLIEVQWARPRNYSKVVVDNQMSFCRSLPPRLRRNNRRESSSPKSKNSSFNSSL